MLRAFLAAALAFAAVVASAQGGPRSLAELKEETVRRAERNAPPIGGVKPEDARTAMAALEDLTPDSWARVFIRNGDRHAARARAAASPDEARLAWYDAWHNYNVGRWPTENSEGKRQAYRLAREAFAAYGRMLSPPVEHARIAFEGAGIPVLIRVPEGRRPAPVVLGVSGLDSRKEDVIAGADGLLRRGIAVVAVDMPGTGEAPIKVDVGAERMFARVLDHIATRPDLDAKRVVVQGRSWSGYWAALLGYTERERLRGVVVHGAPVHAYFQADWQRSALGTREYLFDLLPARSSIYGVATLEDFLAYGPRLSLQARGFLQQPSAPMLLVNGAKDTQVPIEDLYLLMKHGDPKEAWVNPDGGHMGRSREWSSRMIAERVVVPWIARRLAAPGD